MKNSRFIIGVVILLVLLVLFAGRTSAQTSEVPVTVTYNGDCEWEISFVIEGLRPNRDVVIDAISNENRCGTYPTSTGWEGWEVGRTDSDGTLRLSVLHHAWGSYQYRFYTGGQSVETTFAYGSPESYVDSPVEVVSTNEVCSGALPPTLFDGDLGRVTYTDGSPTSLRDEPQGDIIRRLPEGQRFRVISNPVCTSARNGHLWWVQVRANGQVGWVPFGYYEDGDGEYWIEPVPSR